MIEGRAIATTFWGKAWCDNLESYRDFENRLPRGRTYVRNGSVVDLQIAPREVTAMVSGSSLYKVKIGIDDGAAGALAGRSARTARAASIRWSSCCRAGLSKAVMERICRQDAGLFPAAVGDPLRVQLPGLRVDVQACGGGAVRRRRAARPRAGTAVPAARGRRDRAGRRYRRRPADVEARASGSDKMLDGDDVSALFGLDMVVPPAIEQVAVEQVADDVRPPRSRRVASAPKRALPTGKAAASRNQGPPDIDAAAGRSRAARPNSRRRRKGPRPARANA